MVKWFIGFTVALLSLFLSSGAMLSTSGSVNDDVRSGQAPIMVVGDQQFMALAEDLSLPGNGSSGSPYLISGLLIQAGPNETGLELIDLTLSIVIELCDIEGSSGRAGILLRNVTEVSIQTVNMTGFEFGIDVSSGSVSVSGCSISGPGIGIRISGSECVIDRNVLHDAGILMEGSNGPVVAGNWLDGGNGSILAQDCIGGLLENNTVMNAQGNGTDLIGCTDMVLSGNLVHGCTGYAVSLVGSTSNSIVRNSFQYNHGSGDTYAPGNVQGHDGTGFNLWVTEQGKGNHWTDHTGPDVDINGIVDEPYELDGSSSSDRFPLVASPTFISTPPFSISADPLDRRVELNWSRPAATRNVDVIGYNIYRTEEGSVRARIGTVAGPPYVDGPLENGRTYFYWVVAVTPFGEGSYPFGSMAIPDGTPPRIVISSPENGSYHNSSSIGIRLDIPDLSDIHDLYLYIDGAGPFPLAIEENVSLEGLEEGPHRIRFEFSDASMNLGSASIEVIIDTLAPSLVLQGPDGYLNATYADILFNVSDASPEVSVEAIMDRNRTGLVRDGYVRFSGLLDGPNGYVVKAVDSAGNTAIGIGTIYVDRTPPSIDILSPVSGAKYATNYVELEIRASDDPSGLSVVEYRIDAGEWVLWSGDGPLALSLVEGSHTIDARATDLAGQTVSRSTGFSVELPVTVPLNGTIKGRISDGTAGVPGIGIHLNGTVIGVTDIDGVFILELPPGTYGLTFEGEGRASIRMTVTVPSNDTVDLGRIPMEGHDGPVHDAPPVWMIVGLALGTGGLFFVAVALFIVSRKRGDIEKDVWDEE